MYRTTFMGPGYSDAMHDDVERLVDGGYDPETGEVLGPMSYHDARRTLGYAMLEERPQLPLPITDHEERLVDQGVYCAADARDAA